VGVGASLPILGGEHPTIAAAFGGAALLGAVSGLLFRIAGARPAAPLAFASAAAAISAAGALELRTGGPHVQWLALSATTMAAVPTCTLLLTRGNLYDERSQRWFAAPRPVAYLNALGRNLVPRDLRRLQPYSGDRPTVLVVRHHAASGRALAGAPELAIISIVARRRRGAGPLNRHFPFRGRGELVLPATVILAADLELLTRHAGRLRSEA
jgi:hypothetical protein